MATGEDASSVGDHAINVTVKLSRKGGSRDMTLENLPVSTTVGEMKRRLNTSANAILGRAEEFENWDNCRSLADYMVKTGERLDCVVQCAKEDRQTSHDDYDQWLISHQQQLP